ncbi:MAG: OmpA family protein [Flavobacteriales bacterium]|nr:OmpA family protein [Flavobacteriales bacterium]
MRFIVLPTLFVCSLQNTQAQELVINGGLEKVGRCPQGPVIKKLTVDGRVKAAQGDPDLYSACSSSFGVPLNWSGAQPAWNGTTYAGLVLTSDMPDECGSREYLQFPLEHPLENGRRYRLSFRVSVAEYAGYITDRVGAIFSAEDLSRKGVPLRAREHAHMENPLGRLLDDTASWTTVSGLYNATGGEQFVIVGNFHPCNSSTRKAMNADKKASMKRKVDARMDPEPRRGAWHAWMKRTAYVYLDGVSLVADTSAPEHIALLTADQACPHGVAAATGPELIPDPGFDNNVHPKPDSWRNASSGTPDLMNGLTGLYTYSQGYPDNREYIRIPLADTLSPCTTYRIAFDVWRNSTYAYAMDAIGIAVTDTFSIRYDRERLRFPWAWRSPRGLPITHTDAPMTLCGTFTPNLCATQLLLGNFDPDTACTLMLAGNENDGPFAYYYVDNVHLNAVERIAGCVDTCRTKVMMTQTDRVSDPAFPDRLSLYFDTDSDEPLGRYVAELDRLAALLKDEPTLRIRIIGHADDSGTPAHNERLAQARADRLRSALIERGAPDAHITTTSAGSREPIADNTTEEGRAINRRVEVEVVR